MGRPIRKAPPWRKAPSWKSPDGLSQIRSSWCSKARRRSRSPSGESDHRYYSPWVHLNMAAVQSVLLQLEELTDVPPYSFLEFKKSLDRAAEKKRTSSSSVSHYLGTMGRAMTAMIHARNKSSSWEHILHSAMGCARRVCSKSHSESRRAIEEKLYEFLRNRIDFTSIQIITERALTNDDPCPHLSSIERMVTLSMLRDLHDNLQTEYAVNVNVLLDRRERA